MATLRMTRCMSDDMSGTKKKKKKSVPAEGDNLDTQNAHSSEIDVGFSTMCNRTVQRFRTSGLTVLLRQRKGRWQERTTHRTSEANPTLLLDFRH